MAFGDVFLKQLLLPLADAEKVSHATLENPSDKGIRYQVLHDFWGGFRVQAIKVFAYPYEGVLQKILGIIFSDTELKS
jgi:hypothetical protein